MTIWTHDQIGAYPEIPVMDINGDGVDDLIAGGYSRDRVIGYFGPLEEGRREDFWMVDEGLPTLGLAVHWPMRVT